MSSDPFNALDPDAVVEVFPRHLAGPGPVAVADAWPFPFDQGWTFHQPQAGPAVAASPCLLLRTGFLPDPDSPRGGQWLAAAHAEPFGPATWQATFDATTPIELLRDFHTELLSVYLDGAYSHQSPLFADDTAPHEVYLPLLSAGWSHTVRTDGTQSFHSPEALGVLQHRYAMKDTKRPMWTAWAGVPSEPLWRATFTIATPASVVAAFTASLVAPDPLTRAVSSIPSHTRRHAWTPTPPEAGHKAQSASAGLPTSPPASTAGRAR